MKTLIVILLVLSAVFSCTSPSKIMASWVGRSKAELYQSWGPPQQITSDGQGGEILIYSSTAVLAQTPGQIYDNYNGSLSYTAPQMHSYERTRMFYVNTSGVIYHWRWQGY